MAKRPLLYGANGKPLTATAWDASSRERRARQWLPMRSHVNALLSGDVELIRARTREEVRRNAWAAKCQTARVANLVGTGIRPVLELEDRELERSFMEPWSDWVNEADADGTSPFYGLQALASTAFLEGGDCFVRIRPRRAADGLTVPLQIQLLEAEICDPLKNESLPDGTIKAGIDFDLLGRRRFYWMFRSHPDEIVRPFSDTLQAVPVPASEVLHLFHVTRPGQVRGVPGLASVLATLHEIHKADDAFLARMIIQNLYATFEEVPTDDSFSVLDNEGDAIGDDDVPEVTAEAGSHVLLPPGHKVHFGSPPTGAIDHSAFLRDKLRAVAAGSGCLYEQVSGDLSQVNFSSLRAGLIELRRELEQIQVNVLIFQLCRPIWRRFIEALILSGRVEMPEPAQLRRILRPHWQPPGWEYVQPEQEVKAAVRKIRAGLSSRKREAARLGIDVEQLDREIAADNRRAQELGLVFDSDPGTDADGSARAAAVGDSGGSGEGGGDSATGAPESDEEAA